MPKNKKGIIIAKGKFRVGECDDYIMVSTDKVSEDKMEDNLAALNGKEGKLLFRPKSQPWFKVFIRRWGRKWDMP